MKMYCSHRNHGGDVTTTLKKLNSHLMTCQFRPLHCPNKGCGALLTKNQLDSHLPTCKFRTVLCVECGEAVPVKSMKDSSHAAQCSPKPLQCPFHTSGCTFEGLHSQIQQHLQENQQLHQQLHLNQTTRLVATQKKQEEKLEAFLAEVSASLRSNASDLTAKLSEVSAQLASKADTGDVDILGEHVRGLQSISSVHETRIERLEQNRGGSSGGNGLPVGDAATRLNGFDNTITSMERRLVELELRVRLMETASFNGRLIWRLTNYARRKQDAVSGRTLSLYSQPFYTSHFGYKMCARVYLNGAGMGKGTHMSLFFVVMRGECDALHQWPFRQRVSMSLLDQSGGTRHITDNFRPDPTSTSFQRPRGDMNIASGSPLFAEQSVVEGDKYLRDDTIFIRVTVDTTDVPQL